MTQKEIKKEGVAVRWYIVVLLAGLGVLMYVLYDRGYLPVRSMSAIHFVGTMGAGINKCSATFGSATGQIKRVLRFKEGKPYEFTFNGKIRKGTVTVLILDAHKIPELELDGECPSGVINGAKGQRYYLVIRFQNADGEYSLRWD